MRLSVEFEPIDAQPDADIRLSMDADVHVLPTSSAGTRVTPWDVLGPSDVAALHASRAAAVTWWSQHARAEFDGVDCLQLARYRHDRCLTRLLWTAHVVRCALARFDITAVLTRPPAGHALEQSPGRRSMPILHGVVEAVARASGLAVERRTAPSVAAAPPMVPPPRPPGHPLAALEGRAWVLFSGNDGELLRQVPVIDALRAGGTAVVQVYKRAAAETRARLARVGHSLCHESWLGHGPAADTAGPWLTTARAAFDRAAPTAPAELRPLLSGPALAGHWDFIFGAYARAMAGHIQRWTALFERHPPHSVVANYPSAVLDIAAARGIPAVILPHGLLVHGDTALYASLPDGVRIAALSAGHARRLARAAIPAARCPVIGDPAVVDDAAGLTAAVRTAAVGRRVLLLGGHSTSPTVLGRVPEVDWAAALAALALFGRLAARRPTWDVRLRRHPRYDLDAAVYRQLNISVDTASGLDTAVERADVVVVVNALTSAQIEASLAGLPVVMLTSALVGWDAEDWGLAGWPQESDVAALARMLDGLFENADRYAAAARATRRAVRHYLGPAAPPATALERCRALCLLPAAPPPGTICRA